MNQPLEIIANKPWILIILGFVLLISVWITFFTIAVRNQPVKVDPQAATSFSDAPVLLAGIEPVRELRTGSLNRTSPWTLAL